MSKYEGAAAHGLASVACLAAFCLFTQTASAQQATEATANSDLAAADAAQENKRREQSLVDSFQGPSETFTPVGDVTMLDMITVMAGRQEASLMDVPANVTVVTGEELEKLGISDMQQLTRYIPGVTVGRQTSATDPFNTFGGFNIRGVGGNRVLMLSDGSRVSERITDGTRDYLDFNFVRQVDVVRGPASVLWGADALGGVVAVETLDPEDVLNGRKMGGRGRLAYDSFTKSGTASGVFAQRWSDTFTALVAVSRQSGQEPTLSNARADGGIYGCPRDLSVGQLPCNELDPSQSDAYRGLVKFVWTPNEEHRFEASADLLRRTTDVDYTVGLGPQTSGDFVNGYNRDLALTRNRFGFEHRWTPNSGFLDELKTVVAYTPHQYGRSGYKNGFNDIGEAFEAEDSLDYTENFFELDIQATKRLQTGPANHEFTFGFDGDYTTLDYSRTDRRVNLVTGEVIESRAGGFNFANSDTQRADLYIQDVIGLFDDKLEITPGVRFATYRIDPRPNADYKVVTGFEPVVREDTALLKSLSALYHIDDTWSVWGKYGEGFKMPTAQQLYTSLPGTYFDLTPAPNLKPERVKSYEAGVRAQIDDGFISLTGFYADYTDFIQSFYNPPGTNDYTYRNLSAVQVWGVEVEGAYRLTDTLTATGSLAWQKGVQTVRAGADATAHTLPPLTAVLGLNYLLPDYNLSFDAITTMATPVYQVGEVNGFKPGGYALLDLFASWQFAESASLDFGVKNVFDTRYFEASAAGMTTKPTTAVARQNPLELQTGPGRTFTAALNIKF